MSVIVKGMEMPKYCYDCPLQDGEDGRCNILGITVYDTPKECPLIEVVLCSECKHRIIESNDDWCECTGCDINPDSFCSDSERRDYGGLY